jgi:hypothetical protein
MAYLGNTPADRFASYKYQDLTGGSGTSFTLDHPSTTNGLRVVINNVIQEPTEAYSVSGTALTLTGSVSTTDDFYVVFLEQAILSAQVPEKQTDGSYVYLGDVDINGNELILDADADTSITADTDDQIDIKIGGSDVASFTSNGLKMVSGKGIDFSATSDGSGTMSSELLDNYEEGTWTPTNGSADSITFTLVGAASYTRIGNMVHVSAYINFGSSSGSNALQITGLPYSGSISGTVHYTSGAGFNRFNVGTHVLYFDGTNIWSRTDNNVNVTNAQASNDLLVIGLTYRTA